MLIAEDKLGEAGISEVFYYPEFRLANSRKLCLYPSKITNAIK